MKKKGLKDFKSLNKIRFTKEKLFVSSHFLRLHSVHFGDCDSSITDWNIICCFERTDLMFSKKRFGRNLDANMLLCKY